MTGRGLALAWYRFRRTFGDRRAGYMALSVLIALTGGIALASIAAGRRTQSSYPAFLASTHPSDLTVSVYGPNGGAVAPLTSKIARLPGVTRVRTLSDAQIVALSRSGAPRLSITQLVVTAGSTDGLLAKQDLLTAVHGRLANPKRANEVVMTPTAARLIGARVGQTVPMGLYVPAQASLPGFGTASVAPRLRIQAKLVGIVVLNNGVVQDDVDRAYGFVFLTPALMREAVAISPTTGAPILYGIQLRDGASAVAGAEREIVRVIPPGSTYSFHVTSRTLSQVELAIKPESVALGGFGVIALLVCLILGIQAVARQLRAGDEDRQVLRSLGAGVAATTGDGLIGIVASVVVGALLAVALAIGLSPLAPLGPVRAVYPDRGISYDWTVLGLGLVVLIGVLSTAAALLSYRWAPHHVGRLRGRVSIMSRVAGGAEAAGLPAAGVIGARFALESGRGRTAVPVRSALFGAVLAVVTVVATLTFASSLHTLAASPPLYGWNWSYALNPSNDVPPNALRLLDHDADVEAWTGVEYLNMSLDDQTIPVIITLPDTLAPTQSGGVHPAVAPPILTGKGLDGPDDIVLGASTMAALGKHVGESVTLSSGNPGDGALYVPPTTLHIVGTATFPAVGYSSFVEDHTSMGTGALFAFAALPRSFQEAVVATDPNQNGPALVFVRLRPGVGAAAGRANLQNIADAANKAFAADPNTTGFDVSVLGVQRPAQIVNYRSIGSLPVILAVGLAGGAIVALAFTLFASVRRRRRDLALLKALGFTPRQLGAAVAWQATVAALIGLIIGLPVGIVAGRALWTAFAHNLNAVPDPTVPALSIALVALGALVFANLVAAVPGRNAARTSTATLLHAE